MFTPKLLSESELAEYAAKIQALNNADFIAEIGTQVENAGYSSRHCAADQRCKIGYDEAQRRNDPSLYVRAYNKAALRVGMPLDRTFMDAKPSVAAAA